MITHDKTSMIPQAYAEEFGYGYLLGFEELWSGDHDVTANYTLDPPVLKLFRYNKRSGSSSLSIFDVETTGVDQFAFNDESSTYQEGTIFKSVVTDRSTNIKYFAVSPLMTGVNSKNPIYIKTNIQNVSGLVDWYILKNQSWSTDPTVVKHLLLKVKYRESIVIDEPEVYGLDFLVEDNTFKANVDDISRSYFIGSTAILDVDMSKMRSDRPFKLVIKNNLSINKLPSGDS